MNSNLFVDCNFFNFWSTFSTFSIFFVLILCILIMTTFLIFILIRDCWRKRKIKLFVVALFEMQLKTQKWLIWIFFFSSKIHYTKMTETRSQWNVFFSWQQNRWSILCHWKFFWHMSTLRVALNWNDWFLINSCFLSNTRRTRLCNLRFSWFD